MSFTCCRFSSCLTRSSRAALRLGILAITRRPLVSPPVPERELNLATLPPLSNASSPTLAPSSPSTSSPLTTPDHLRNNHVPLPPHHLLVPPPLPTKSLSPIDDFLLPKALSSSSVKVPSALLKPLSSPKDWLSEITYVIRPLIYGECEHYRSASSVVNDSSRCFQLSCCRVTPILADH
jgi:peroxin-16